MTADSLLTRKARSALSGVFGRARRTRRTRRTRICSVRSKPSKAIAAAAQKQPAYVIFPDRTLIEMAKERPRGLDDLAGIYDVGSVKLQKYGSAFLTVIRDSAHA